MSWPHISGIRIVNRHSPWGILSVRVKRGPPTTDEKMGIRCGRGKSDTVGPILTRFVHTGRRSA